MKKAKFTVAVVLSASIALSACSGETASTPSASGSSTPISREAASYTTPFSVENQLKDWWGGEGIPITWKVSETVNADWDGDRRPDHAPPKGFQGLVQEPFSGPFAVNIEWNGMVFTYGSRFVLTPVITIDGQTIDLLPIVAKPGEKLVAAGSSCKMIQGEWTTSTASMSAKTPRGLLTYDVVLTCNNPTDHQKILIRNYQKS